jgi:hypothetical protein
MGFPMYELLIVTWLQLVAVNMWPYKFDDIMYLY